MPEFNREELLSLGKQGRLILIEIDLMTAYGLIRNSHDLPVKIVDQHGAIPGYSVIHKHSFRTHYGYARKMFGNCVRLVISSTKEMVFRIKEEDHV